LTAKTSSTVKSATSGPRCAWPSSRGLENCCALRAGSLKSLRPGCSLLLTPQNPPQVKLSPNSPICTNILMQSKLAESYKGKPDSTKCKPKEGRIHLGAHLESPIFRFNSHATHACTLQPAALVFVSYGFVFVRVRVWNPPARTHRPLISEAPNNEATIPARGTKEYFFGLEDTPHGQL